MYNPITGLMNVKTWKDRRYIIFWYLGKSTRVHRFAFLQEKGYIPIEVDHKDRNKSNNKWDNLRDSTRSQNCRNSSKKKRKCKFIGVVEETHKKTHKIYTYYVGAISIEGKRYRTYKYRCETAAAIARDKLIIKYNDNHSIINILGVQ